jgi:hypothetical protein
MVASAWDSFIVQLPVDEPDVQAAVLAGANCVIVISVLEAVLYGFSNNSLNS